MFKDKEEFELFNHINSHDPKTPIERALKLSEECGEVAEAVLSSQSVSGSEYKTADRFDVIEECVDVIIVAKSIIASVINANGTKDIRPELAMNVIGKVYDIKMDKWQEKCSVPPMEVDGSCIESKKDETKVFSYKKFVGDRAVMAGTIKLRECLKGMDGFVVEKKAGANSWYTIECTGEDVHEDWIVPESEFKFRIAADTLVVDIQKWVADMGIIDDDLYKLDGVEIRRHDVGDWYIVKYEDREYNVHNDWLTPYGEFVKRKWGK